MNDTSKKPIDFGQIERGGDRRTPPAVDVDTLSAEVESFTRAVHVLAEKMQDLADEVRASRRASRRT